MYKYFGIALLGIFATMLIPAGAEPSTNLGSTFYGIAHVTTFDAAGNPTSSQSVHNDLIDLGEDFIIKQVFQEGTAAELENASIATICLTEDIAFNDPIGAVDNTITVAGFDSNDGMTVTANCIEDSTVVQSGTNGVGIATLDADGTTFDAGTHADQDEEVTGIGICPALVAAGTTTNGCAATGDGTNLVLFAIVDITDFTLGAGESATITYTFDVDEEA